MVRDMDYVYDKDALVMEAPFCDGFGRWFLDGDFEVKGD